MRGAGVKVKGLAHVILWRMIGSTPPVHIAMAAIHRIGSDGLEPALYKERRNALADKAIVVATDKHDLLREGIGTDAETHITGGGFHLAGEAGMKGAIGDNIQYGMKKERHVEGHIGNNIFFRNGGMMNIIVAAEETIFFSGDDGDDHRSFGRRRQITEGTGDLQQDSHAGGIVMGAVVDGIALYRRTDAEVIEMGGVDDVLVL